jgi:hypothetical protein
MPPGTKVRQPIVDRSPGFSARDGFASPATVETKSCVLGALKTVSGYRAIFLHLVAPDVLSFSSGATRCCGETADPRKCG